MSSLLNESFPIPLNKLLPHLKNVEAFLTTQDESPDEKTLKKLSNNLITQLGRREPDAQVYTLKCIIQLLRTTAPDMPFTNDQSKVMFRALLSTFELLESNKEVLYQDAFGLLELCDQLRLFDVALLLDDPELLDDIYSTLIKILRPWNAVGIEKFVVRIITALIESADDIYPSQFNILFDYVIPNKKEYAEIHHKAACEVFRSAAESLQRPLSIYFKQILFDPIVLYDEEIRKSQSASPSHQDKTAGKQPKSKAKQFSKTPLNPVADSKSLVVIETLHIHAPLCLFFTYPLLTDMLRIDTIAIRLSFVSLVARMMKGNTTALVSLADGLLKEWMGRFRDKSEVIRERLCASTMQIGHANPTIIPQFIKPLNESLEDLNDSVRVAAIHSVSSFFTDSCFYKQFTPKMSSDLSLRLRDKDDLVRQTTFVSLSFIFLHAFNAGGFDRFTVFPAPPQDVTEVSDTPRGQSQIEEKSGTMVDLFLDGDAFESAITEDDVMSIVNVEKKEKMKQLRHSLRIACNAIMGMFKVNSTRSYLLVFLEDLLLPPTSSSSLRAYNLLRFFSSLSSSSKQLFQHFLRVRYNVSASFLRFLINFRNVAVNKQALDNQFSTPQHSRGADLGRRLSLSQAEVEMNLSNHVGPGMQRTFVALCEKLDLDTVNDWIDLIKSSHSDPTHVATRTLLSRLLDRMRGLLDDVDPSKSKESQLAPRLLLLLRWSVVMLLSRNAVNWLCAISASFAMTVSDDYLNLTLDSLFNSNEDELLDEEVDVPTTRQTLFEMAMDPHTPLRRTTTHGLRRTSTEMAIDDQSGVFKVGQMERIVDMVAEHAQCNRVSLSLFSVVQTSPLVGFNKDRNDVQTPPHSILTSPAALRPRELEDESDDGNEWEYQQSQSVGLKTLSDPAKESVRKEQAAMNGMELALIFAEASPSLFLSQSSVNPRLDESLMENLTYLASEMASLASKHYQNDKRVPVQFLRSPPPPQTKKGKQVVQPSHRLFPFNNTVLEQSPMPQSKKKNSSESTQSVHLDLSFCMSTSLMESINEIKNATEASVPFIPYVQQNPMHVWPLTLATIDSQDPVRLYPTHASPTVKAKGTSTSDYRITHLSASLPSEQPLLHPTSLFFVELLLLCKGENHELRRRALKILSTVANTFVPSKLIDAEGIEERPKDVVLDFRRERGTPLRLDLRTENDERTDRHWGLSDASVCVWSIEVLIGLTFIPDDQMNRLAFRVAERICDIIEAVSPPPPPPPPPKPSKPKKGKKAQAEAPPSEMLIDQATPTPRPALYQKLTFMTLSLCLSSLNTIEYGDSLSTQHTTPIDADKVIDASEVLRVLGVVLSEGDAVVNVICSKRMIQRVLQLICAVAWVDERGPAPNTIPVQQKGKGKSKAKAQQVQPVSDESEAEKLRQSLIDSAQTTPRGFARLSAQCVLICSVFRVLCAVFVSRRVNRGILPTAEEQLQLSEHGILPLLFSEENSFTSDSDWICDSNTLRPFLFEYQRLLTAHLLFLSQQQLLTVNFIITPNLFDHFQVRPSLPTITLNTLTRDWVSLTALMNLWLFQRVTPVPLFTTSHSYKQQLSFDQAATATPSRDNFFTPISAAADNPYYNSPSSVTVRSGMSADSDSFGRNVLITPRQDERIIFATLQHTSLNVRNALFRLLSSLLYHRRLPPRTLSVLFLFILCEPKPPHFETELRRCFDVWVQSALAASRSIRSQPEIHGRQSMNRLWPLRPESSFGYLVHQLAHHPKVSTDLIPEIRRRNSGHKHVDSVKAVIDKFVQVCVESQIDLQIMQEQLDLIEKSADRFDNDAMANRRDHSVTGSQRVEFIVISSRRIVEDKMSKQKKRDDKGGRTQLDFHVSVPNTLFENKPELRPSMVAGLARPILNAGEDMESDYGGPVQQVIVPEVKKVKRTVMTIPDESDEDDIVERVAKHKGQAKPKRKPRRLLP
ncbi:putative Sister chromatid cohesion protein pds5 [Blattamonas nauphoetae]|uniref:Sister chromatid cohesion protein pds5 n=1 Tax=Blattamonas nauphoetae TaxID=2049346 RepID=A0ABQ9XSP0_9EUKA|nr:putative Sister chromatid cohesion protein pds5 [Blattamonas nauphoetae]